MFLNMMFPVRWTCSPTGYLTAVLGPLFFCGTVTAQLLDPADWRCTSDTIAIGGEGTIFLEVVLDEGWYIYSPDQDPDLGPVPTSVTFGEDGSYELVGGLVPIGAREKYDDVWEGTVRTISGSGGGLEQRIRVLRKGATVRGTISYTVCSERTGQCIFPEEDFELVINTGGKR